MKTRILAIIFLTLTLILWADFSDFYYDVSNAFSGLADPNTGLTIFPTLLIPMGGRFEGMGTAFTAVSDDASFLESNPAGSSTLAYSELSFRHHNWIADSNLEGVVWTTRAGDLGIGIGAKFLYVPFTEYNAWGERASKGYISESIAIFNISYNFFNCFEFYGLSLGANFKAAYRHIPASIYPGQSVLTGMVDLGMLTRFNLFKPYHSRKKNFSVGATLKNLGLNGLGEPLPLVFSTGVAYSFFRPLLISVDFNLPLSFHPGLPAERWYIATGFEVVVTDFLAIQTGFQIKENPRVSLGTNIDLKNVRFDINYNLDLSGSINPIDKFSVEASINLGDGGRKALQRKIDDLYVQGLHAYAEGKLEESLGYWKEILELNPKFTPAKRYLEITEKHLELLEEVEANLRIPENIR